MLLGFVGFWLSTTLGLDSLAFAARFEVLVGGVLVGLLSDVVDGGCLRSVLLVWSDLIMMLCLHALMVVVAFDLFFYQIIVLFYFF